MIDSFASYMESLVQQAEDRDTNQIRTVEAYLQNRREDGATKPSFVPLELGLDLIDEVFYHPVLVELAKNIADMLCLNNVLNFHVFLNTFYLRLTH